MLILPLRHQSKGFTVLEVLIVVAAITLGVLGIASMTRGARPDVPFHDQLKTATELAQERIEGIKKADYRQVTSAHYPDEEYRTIAEYEPFQRTVTIDADTPEADMKTISVAVSWQDDTGATVTITLSTIIAP